jgi:hypothetical protein
MFTPTSIVTLPAVAVNTFSAICDFVRCKQVSIAMASTSRSSWLPHSKDGNHELCVTMN